MPEQVIIWNPKDYSDHQKRKAKKAIESCLTSWILLIIGFGLVCAFFR